jgi:hypothetical protein
MKQANNDLTLYCSADYPPVSLGKSTHSPRQKEKIMSTAPKPQMEVQDPVKVDPKHYKVEVEMRRCAFSESTTEHTRSR